MFRDPDLFARPLGRPGRPAAHPARSAAPSHAARREGPGSLPSHGANLAPSAPATGFTLIELLVVLAIVGIVAGMAVTDLSSFIGRYRLNSAAEALADAVGECRAKAIAQNRECAVRLVTSDANLTGDWRQNAGRYEVLVARVGAAGLSWVAADDSVTDLASGPGAAPGVSIEPWAALSGPPGGALPDALVFNPRGFSANALSDFASGGVARIVLRNKRSTSVEQRVVRVDRGGNVQIAVP